MTKPLRARVFEPGEQRSYACRQSLQLLPSARLCIAYGAGSSLAARGQCRPWSELRQRVDSTQQGAHCRKVLRNVRIRGQVVAHEHAGVGVEMARCGRETGPVGQGQRLPFRALPCGVCRQLLAREAQRKSLATAGYEIAVIVQAATQWPQRAWRRLQAFDLPVTPGLQGPGQPLVHCRWYCLRHCR